MAGANRSPGLQFENEVRQNLRRIGLKDVAGGPDFRIGEYQIDACGGWDDVLLVLECKQSGSDTASIHSDINTLRGKQPGIRRAFRAIAKYETYRRIEFAIVTRNIRFTEGDHRIAKEKPPVHLIDIQTLTYYQKLQSLIGRGALFNFLGELGISPRDITMPRLPAFKVRLTKNLPGYLFWCEPHKLIEIAYVARRESGRAEFYQRMLTAPRLKNIRDFIQKGNIFPNNIIVAFDKRPEFRRKLGYETEWPPWLQFGELVFPNSYRSCWIIDGQHRLFSFGQLDPNPTGQKLAVFAFEPISEARQASFFIQINKEQKAVSPDLIWDLEGEMSPDTPRGRIANCVKHLNSISPLNDTVSLPLSGASGKRPLKMSGVCIDFLETGLLNDRTQHMTQTQHNPLAHRVTLDRIPQRVASAVAEFLSQVRGCSTQNIWERIFLKPGGITVAIHIYEQILIGVVHRPSNTELKPYAEALVAAFSDLAPTQQGINNFARDHLSSYAQRRQVLSQIIHAMQQRMNDHEFGKARVKTSEPLEQRFARFERRLAETTFDRLSIANVDDLKQKTHQSIWTAVSNRMDPNKPLHEAPTLGEIREIISRKDNAKVMMPLFTDSEEGFGDSDGVLAALQGIIRFRNAMDHGRRSGNRQLAVAFLETFERLLG